MASALALALTLGGAPVRASAGTGSEGMRLEIPADATPAAYLVVDASGKVVQNAAPRIETKDGKRFAVAEGVGIQLLCTAWPAPAPTYSQGNPPTMHYGVAGLCDQPIPLKARTSLWSGPKADSANIWQDETGWDYRLETIFSGDTKFCLSWGVATWWELLMYVEGQVNGVWTRFTPYPGRALTQTPCEDIS